LTLGPLHISAISTQIPVDACLSMWRYPNCINRANSLAFSTPNASFLIECYFRVAVLRLRVVAKFASQRASFHKDQIPHTRAVMKRESLNVEDKSGIFTLSH